MSGWPVLLGVAAINFSSAFLQAASGFGYAMAAMSLMPLLLPMRQCSAVSAVTVLAIAVQMSLALRKHLNPRRVCLPMVCCIPTIHLGVFLLTHGSERGLRLTLACMILALCAFSAFSRRKNLRLRSPLWGAAAGLLTGLSTGMFNIVGPFLLVYYMNICEDTLEFKASMELSFLLAGSYTAAIHLLTGTIVAGDWPLYAASAGAALAAGHLGLKLFRRARQQTIARITTVLLPILALILLANS